MRKFLTDIKEKIKTRKAFACVDRVDLPALQDLIDKGFDVNTKRMAVLQDEKTNKKFTMSFEETVGSKSLREGRHHILRNLLEKSDLSKLILFDHVVQEPLEMIATQAMSKTEVPKWSGKLKDLKPEDNDMLFCFKALWSNKNILPQAQNLSTPPFAGFTRISQELEDWLNTPSPLSLSLSRSQKP